MSGVAHEEVPVKGTAFTKLTGCRQQIALERKAPKNITGYQIQYSQKESFSGKKTVKIAKARTLKTTIRKLKAGKTYYVRIRTYKTVNKKTYWSAWSGAVTVKTKAAKANGTTDARDGGTAMGEDDALLLDLEGETVPDGSAAQEDVELEMDAEAPVA